MDLHLYDTICHDITCHDNLTLVKLFMNINKFSAFNYYAHQSSDVFEMSLVVAISQCIFDF
jgi:hypothetical protein